jgi:hypothetical protein
MDPAVELATAAVERPPPTSSVRIACAFALSLAPAAAAWSGQLELGRASMLGLALVPWIALAGMPGLARASRWVAVCAPWPALALGAALDARAGTPWEQLAPTLAWGALIVAALSALAARDSGAARVELYDVAWLVALVAIPLARFALDYGAGGSAAPRWLAALAAWSPLEWALARAGDAGARPPVVPWQPWLVVAVLALARRADARREVRA